MKKKEKIKMKRLSKTSSIFQSHKRKNQVKLVYKTKRKIAMKNKFKRRKKNLSKRKMNK